MNHTNLDQFGTEFILRIRDAAIEEYQMVKSGEMNSVSAKKIFKHFSSFSEEQKKKIDAIVLDSMEMMLHKFLFYFEENDNWAIVEKGPAENSGLSHLAEVSDGLSGELYSDDGWIAKFSKYKTNSMKEK